MKKATAAALAFCCLQPTSVLAADCPTRSPLPLNLAWSRLDANGIPQNPWWSIQNAQGPQGLPDPDDKCMCGGFPTNKPGGVPFGSPRCTDQIGPNAADLPQGFHKFVCGLEWFVDGRRNVTRGHINWLPATVTGFISFGSKSGPDDDYNFELIPDSKAPNGAPPGLTAWNEGDRPSYHVELKGAEAIQPLTQAWWVQFREAVAKSQQGARDLLKNRPASVIGLFGLDAEHKGHSELHPAHVIAVQTSCSAQASADGFFQQKWAVFLRNSGNEGFCSRWKDQHFLDVTDGLTLVTLPLGSTARDALISGSDLFGSSLGMSGPHLIRDAAGNVQVAFRWATTDPALKDRPARIHGTLDIKWKPARPGDPVCAQLPPDLGASLKARSADELEDFLESSWKPGPDIGASSIAPAKDTHRLDARVLVPAPHQPVGVCPDGAPQCADALRSRFKDRLAAPVDLAAATDEEDANMERTLCAGAAAQLDELRHRAAAPGASDRAKRDVSRAEALLSYCNLEE